MSASVVALRRHKALQCHEASKPWDVEALKHIAPKRFVRIEALHSGPALALASGHLATETEYRPSPPQGGHSADSAATLTDLPDDLMFTISLGTPAGSAGERLSVLHNLSSVCKGLASLRALPAARAIASQAAHELLCGACLHAGPGSTTEDYTEAAVIDLSGRNIQAIECKLLALRLADGALANTRSLWLQNNQIDAEALRALARGLRWMPPQQLSISLGMNPFSGCLPEGKAAQQVLARPEVRRAVRDLKSAACERGVRLRLWS